MVIADFIGRHGDPDLAYRAPSMPWDAPPPISEAWRWLHNADEHGDVREGLVVAVLAVMYGTQRYYDRMIATLRRVANEYPAQLTYLRRQDQIAICSYACIAQTEENLGELGALIGIDQLPMTPEVVRAAIDAVDLSDNNASNHFIDFYVAGRFSRWSTDDIGRFPVLIRILLNQDEQGNRMGRLILIPSILSTHGDLFDNTRSPRSIDEILGQLEPLVYFLCRADRG